MGEDAVQGDIGFAVEIRGLIRVRVLDLTLEGAAGRDVRGEEKVDAIKFCVRSNRG